MLAAVDGGFMKSITGMARFAFIILPLLIFNSAGEVRGQSSKEIVDAAKKDGQLVFYAGIPVPDAQAILAVFEKKYPFIKTTFYRSTGPALVSRIQTEQRAGQSVWDVMNSTGFEPYVLLEQGYFTKYESPERKHFPEGHKDSEGYWATMYTSPNLMSYNTRLVSSKDLPKDYSELLDPKWKGKLGLDSSDFEWYCELEEDMGK
jgi:iron(III) transport system substrate-binding protein